MSSNCHRQRLSAFEEEDPLVAGLQSKITKFQQKQKKQLSREKYYYDWIQTQRKLNDAEAALSSQLLNVGSNVVEYLQKEQDHEGVYQLCDIDPNSRTNAVKSIQDDMALFQTPIQDNKIRDIFIEKNNRQQSLSDDGARQEYNPLCAKLLLDLRESLATSLEEVDGRYYNLSKETRQHRRKVMLLMSGDHNKENQQCLPQSLSKAMESLHLLQESQSIEDGGEIDLLEIDLMRDLQDASDARDSILAETATSQIKMEPQCWDEKSRIVFKKALASSNGNICGNKHLLERLQKEIPGKSEQEINEYLKYTKLKTANRQKAEAASQEYKKKCQEIEKNGLKEIERLRKEFNSRSKRTRANAENDLKRKEMNLRLMAMRLEREQAQKAETERRIQVMAKKVGSEYGKEVQRTQRILETKQSLMKHQINIAVQEGEDPHNSLHDDFAVEIDSLKHKHANRERTNYRQEQMRSKIVAQKKAEDEAFKEEEKRLNGLAAIAASVPYYKSIMDKSSDIHKSTEARKNDVYGRSKLADFQSGNLKSFTNERHFGNFPFRLGVALHEAGLAHSTYARDVIRNAIPRSEARTTGIKPY